MKLKVLVVVVVESGKGVIRKRQYAQVRTTRIHLKLTHLKEKVQSDQKIKKKLKPDCEGSSPGGKPGQGSADLRPPSHP